MTVIEADWKLQEYNSSEPLCGFEIYYLQINLLEQVSVECDTPDPIFLSALLYDLKLSPDTRQSYLIPLFYFMPPCLEAKASNSNETNIKQVVTNCVPDPVQ